MNTVPLASGRTFRLRGFAAALRLPLPLLATVMVCGLLYGYAAVRYPHFSDAQTFVNLIGSGNAYLGITAVGLTFVILAGGIDLSVGAVIGCSTVFLAVLIEHRHWPPAWAVVAVLAIGTGFGAGQGSLIRFFNVPPFLLTLAGLFLARGAGLVISAEQIPITHPLYTRTLQHVAVVLGHDARRVAITLPLQAMVFLAVLLVGIGVARFTRFGRNCYAVGGSEASAVLMGLPVGSTKIGVYALSGFCAALGGVVYTIDSQNGNANYAVGNELDAIAAVVVGGTVLTGGTGSVLGTLFGFLTFAIMNTAIDFDGRLPAAWKRIFVGGLLLAFILLQKGIQSRARS